MLATRRRALVAFVLVVAAPAVAHASPLDDARVALEDQRYEEALATLATLTSEGTPARQQVVALELAATAYLLMGREAEARPLVRRLYELAPAFVLSDRSLPPRVTTMFEAEAARPHARAVGLVARSVSSDVADYELTLVGTADHVEMACASSERAPFVRVALSPTSSPDRLAFRLPTMGTYRCHAVALDRDELPLGRLGTRSEPVTLRALEKPRIVREQSSVVGRWWFWTGVGLAAVGSAVAIGFAVRPDEPVPPPADVTVTPLRF